VKISELGSGKYGKVFLAKEKANQFLCALKIVEKKLLKDEEITEQFVRELKIQMFVNHPNIIKMYGYFEDPTNIYIVLEVALGGHLYNLIRPGSGMS
jgi:serine/threonine protein kinase